MDYLDEICILKSLYEVSKDGVVKRISDGKVFVPGLDKKGYYRLRIKIPYFSKHRDGMKTYKIHRLVAMYYLDDYSPDLQVNHKNGIKTDNRVENLEMVTNRENVIHAWRVLDSTMRKKRLSNWRDPDTGRFTIRSNG